jgi:hypothetical protein
MGGEGPSKNGANRHNRTLILKRFDANRDGRLDRKERAAMQRALAAHRGGRGK